MTEEREKKIRRKKETPLIIEGINTTKEARLINQSSRRTIGQERVYRPRLEAPV